MSRQHFSRLDRFAQMSKQEQIIAKKRKEILEKQRTAELAKQVAAAQNTAAQTRTESLGVEELECSIQAPSLKNTKNTFCNDGSFLAHFKKILEQNTPKAAEQPPTDAESQQTEVDLNLQQSQPEAEALDGLVPEPDQNQTENEIQQSQPSPPLPHMELSSQLINHNSFFNSAIPPPIMNIRITAPPPPPPPPPPPLPQISTTPVSISNNIQTSAPLYTIPPPEPLQLNTIPEPGAIDLNTIPKPQLNLEAIQVPTDNAKVFSDDSKASLPSSIEAVIDLVAEFGDTYEDKLRSQKNSLHPSLWFLCNKTSKQYLKYRQDLAITREQRLEKDDEMIRIIRDYPKTTSSHDDKYDPECIIGHDEDSDDEYMRSMMDRNRNNLKRRIEHHNDSRDDQNMQRDEKKKNRKSRWGEKIDEYQKDIPTISTFGNQNKPLLCAIQRTDPGLLQYARQNYGTIELDEEDWKKCEAHYKVNLLYQNMLQKRQEIDRLAKTGKFKYEYDSDEDVTGGTWEHKLRNAEMEATHAWATALTKQCEGKHHIGDFLPPEELKKFMEQYEAKKSNRQPDLSDYKEYKLKEDNIGFQMLQKLGWKEGQGLGIGGTGIVEPLNKASQRDGNQGLGVSNTTTLEGSDNEYDAYRKRMMLAYRFRPNPLNNPRRAYY